MRLNAEGTEGKISAVLFIATNSDFCSGLLEKHVVDLEKSPAMEKKTTVEDLHLGDDLARS